MRLPAYFPVPQAAAEAADPDGSNPGAWALEAGFISNGAYTLETWNHESSMTHVKNPNYHRADEVKVEKLEFMLSSDDAAIYSAYQAGNLTSSTPSPPTRWPTPSRARSTPATLSWATTMWPSTSIPHV